MKVLLILAACMGATVMVFKGFTVGMIAVAVVFAVAFSVYHYKHSCAPMWWVICTVFITPAAFFMGRAFMDQGISLAAPLALCLVWIGGSWIWLLIRRKNIRERNSRKKRALLQDLAELEAPFEKNDFRTTRDIVLGLEESLSSCSSMLQEEICTRLAQDYMIALETYPNSRFPIGRVLDQTDSEFGKHTANLLREIHAFERAVDALENLGSFSAEIWTLLRQISRQAEYVLKNLYEERSRAEELLALIKTAAHSQRVPAAGKHRNLVYRLESCCRDYELILQSCEKSDGKLRGIYRQGMEKARGCGRPI